MATKKFYIRENASRRSAPEFRQMAIDELPTLRAAKDAAKSACEAKRRELLAVPEYTALVAEQKRAMDELDAAARKARYFRYAVVEDGGWCTIYKSEHDSQDAAKAALRDLKAVK